MSRAQKHFFLVVFVVGVALAIAYVRFWVWTAVVINKSDKALSGVKVEFAGKLLWAGELPAGDYKKIYGLVDRDGDAIASYEFDGNRVEVSCGYVTSGPIAGFFKFTLMPEHDGCGYDN